MQEKNKNLFSLTCEYCISNYYVVYYVFLQTCFNRFSVIYKNKRVL